MKYLLLFLLLVQCIFLYSQQMEEIELPTPDYSGIINHQNSVIYFTNGIPDSVKIENVYLAHEKKLTGIYKNGKPFKGYFLQPKNGWEIPIVDWYENGIVVKQFSKKGIGAQIAEAYQTKKDIIANYGQPAVLDVETTFKDGKPFDGVFYKQAGNIFFEEYISKGRTKYMYMVIAAVNAAALMQLEVLPGGYAFKYFDVSENEKGFKIDTVKNVTTFADESGAIGHTEIWMNNQKLISYQFNNHQLKSNENLPVDFMSRSYYMHPNDSSNLYLYDQIQVERDTAVLNSLQESGAIHKLDMIANLIVPKNLNDTEGLAAMLYQSDNSRAYLLKGDEGKYFGTLINKNDNNTYSYKLYKEDGKIITNQKQFSTLKELWASIQNEK